MKKIEAKEDLIGARVVGFEMDPDALGLSITHIVLDNGVKIGLARVIADEVIPVDKKLKAGHRRLVLRFNFLIPGPAEKNTKPVLLNWMRRIIARRRVRKALRSMDGFDDALAQFRDSKGALNRALEQL